MVCKLALSDHRRLEEILRKIKYHKYNLYRNTEEIEKKKTYAGEP
jgi:hypothetical protein